MIVTNKNMTELSNVGTNTSSSVIANGKPFGVGYKCFNIASFAIFEPIDNTYLCCGVFCFEERIKMLKNNYFKMKYKKITITNELPIVQLLKQLHTDL